MAAKSKPSTRIHFVAQPSGFLADAVRDQLTASPSIEVSESQTLVDAPGIETIDVVFVAFQNATERLASLIEELEDIGQATEQWTAETSAFLKAAKKVRRNLVLVDARKFLSGETDALKRHGYQGSTSTPRGHDAPKPLSVVLANSALQIDANALRMRAEIDALMTGPKHEALTREILHAAYSELRGKSGETHSPCEGVQHNMVSAKEADLLRENVSLREHEAASYDDEISRLVQQVADRHVQKAQNDALQKRLDMQKNEASAREAILGKTILDEKNAHHASQEQGRSELEALRGQLAEAHFELERVYASNSWKITKPLRSLRPGSNRSG